MEAAYRACMLVRRRTPDRLPRGARVAPVGPASWKEGRVAAWAPQDGWNVPVATVCGQHLITARPQLRLLKD